MVRLLVRAHGLMDGLCCCSKVVRKSIARVLTVISQSQRTALRNAYSNKVQRLCRPLHSALHAVLLQCLRCAADVAVERMA